MCAWLLVFLLGLYLLPSSQFHPDSKTYVPPIHYLAQVTFPPGPSLIPNRLPGFPGTMLDLNEFLLGIENRGQTMKHYLWPPMRSRFGHSIFVLVSSSFFPHLFSAVGDWMSAILRSTHDVALVWIYKCRSEACCTRLAENIRDAKKSPNNAPYGHSRTTLYSTLFAIYTAAIENKHNKTKAANSTRPHDKCIKCYCLQCHTLTMHVQYCIVGLLYLRN